MKPLLTLNLSIVDRLNISVLVYQLHPDGERMLVGDHLSVKRAYVRIPDELREVLFEVDADLGRFPVLVSATVGLHQRGDIRTATDWTLG